MFRFSERFRDSEVEEGVAVIGITGGISTGKSTFAKSLRGLLPAAFFFDADVMARELTHRDQSVLREIRAQFGAEVFDANGDLNRAQLRSIVFTDGDKKRALEEILHPRIRRQWTTEAEIRRNSTELFFADIPLLYETAGETLCDAVVVVACSGTVQLQRLMNRGPFDRVTAEQLIAAQMPLTEKIRRADHVVWNNGAPAVLGAQAAILAKRWQS